MKKAKTRKTKKSKTSDLEVAYRAVPLHGLTAAEFVFDALTVVAVNVPGVGTFVVGKDGEPGMRIAWAYDSGTSFQEAVQKSFRDIVTRACATYAELKKIKK